MAARVVGPVGVVEALGVVGLVGTLSAHMIMVAMPSSRDGCWLPPQERAGTAVPQARAEHRTPPALCTRDHAMHVYVADRDIPRFGAFSAPHRGWILDGYSTRIRAESGSR